MTDFSKWGNAPTEQPGADFGALIPAGTLAWAVVKVRPYNLQSNMVLVPSKTSANKYLDVELTIEGGKYDKRKVWDKLGLIGPSEGWVTAGHAAVRHIIEVHRGIKSDFHDGNPKYDIGGGITDERCLMDLNGMRCGVMIGIEKGKDGYEDKNKVSAYLSPNPESKSTHKHFLRLVAGDVEPKDKAAPAASKTQAAPWAPPAAPAKPVANERPAWGGPPPPSRAAPRHDDEEIPF